jgi:hypothetical protein
MLEQIAPHIEVSLDLIKTIAGFLIPIITSIITWFVVKRHYQQRELALKDVVIDSHIVDNESVAVEILSKKLGFYNKMLDDLEARCKKQSDALEVEIDTLKLKVIKLREYNEQLEKKIREYEKDL